MELNPTTLGWIAAVVVFYLIGFFEGRAKGYKKRKKEEASEKENQSAPPPEVVTETITETVTVQVDDPGMLRIKNEGGAYRLDLDGRRVDPTALPPEQRKRLIEILSIMRPWLEGRPAPAPTPPAITSAPPPAQTPPAGVPFRPAAPASLSSSTPAEAPRQSTLVPSVSPAAPVTPPTAAPKPGVPAKDAPPAPAPKSIVGQIDAILQTRLIGTPLEKYAIHLTESPQGGANVYVGSNRYDTVDEVPDPEIKAAIRAATKEWEDKYTPGL